jgi:GTPase
MTDHSDSLVYSKLYIPSEGKLKPETDKSGNIEYKLRLDRKDAKGCTKMVSQMLWRLSEGNNEAHYILGVYDNGSLSTITEIDLNVTIGILKGIVKSAKAIVVSEKIYVFPKNCFVAHITIRKDYSKKNVPELKVVICGVCSVGKSTLMGKLTYDQRDNGLGFSRALVLRHQHEKISGVTSCPKYDTIGFSGKYVLNYAVGTEFNQENIYNMADRMVDIIDMPGDMKYLKTILYTVSSLNPKYMLLCIPLASESKIDNLSDSIDLSNMTKSPKAKKNQTNISISKLIQDSQLDDMNNDISIDNDIQQDMCTHVKQVIKDNYEYYGLMIALCIAYNIQPIIIFTKTDMVEFTANPSIDIEYCHRTVYKIFNKWQNVAMFPCDSAECNDIDSINDEHKTCDSIDFCNAPVISISNVNGDGFEKLIESISLMKQTIVKPYINSDCLFIVHDVFTIPDIGQILHGSLISGTMNTNDEINILCTTTIITKKIKTIQRKTIDIDRLNQGETGSITLFGRSDKNIEKTSILFNGDWSNRIVSSCRVKSFFSSTILKPQRYTLFVHNCIVTVMLSETASPDSSNIFDVTCANNSKFLLNTCVGVLKDDIGDYQIVQFVN